MKRNIISESFYKKFKNKLINEINRAKKNYNMSAFRRSRGNMKATWKLINRALMKNMGRSSVTTLRNNDVEIKDCTQISNLCNDYFSSVASELESTIPVSAGDPIDNIHFDSVNSLFFSYVSDNEIITVTRKLKNCTYGLHCIPTKIFKLVIDNLLYPLSSCLLYTSPSPRDKRQSRMPSSA